jgi:putative heme-binding domain-containing protein
MQDNRTLKLLFAAESTANFPAEAQIQAVQRLMASTGGALVLLRMAEAKSLPAKLQHDIVARAANHPDSNVRVLFEPFIPEDKRPKRLGDAITLDEILALDGDPERGQQIFFQSSAAQCKNCHVVQGQGTSFGPDLSQIGKKYERQTLLETILEPSKAIAPEYYAYLLETRAGQVYVGFLVEQNEQHVILKDAQGKLIRTASSDVAELVKHDKSLMPELVLRDVTAQDAADLLAYLVTLTEEQAKTKRN